MTRGGVVRRYGARRAPVARDLAGEANGQALANNSGVRGRAARPRELARQVGQLGLGASCGAGWPRRNRCCIVCVSLRRRGQRAGSHLKPNPFGGAPMIAARRLATPTFFAVFLSMALARVGGSQEIAQAPGLRFSPHLASTPTYSRVLLLHQGHTRIRRTYWLEGGSILGGALGLLGAVAGVSLCRQSDSPHGSCVGGIAWFALGAAVGFPLGALIGGQFPKQDALTPPPN